MSHKKIKGYFAVVSVIIMVTVSIIPIFGHSQEISNQYILIKKSHEILQNDKSILSTREKNFYDIVQSSKGSTIYVGGGPGNYSTIQEAINSAADGDTIYIYAGIYYENPIVNKSIELIGVDKVSTIIDGSGLGNTLTIERDYVNISSLTIRNGGNNGILMDNARWCILNDNLITNNEESGLYARSCINNIISNSSFSYNGYGIYCDHYSRECTIIDNEMIQNEFRGIFIKTSSNNTLESNFLSNNGEGIALSYATDNTITLCVVQDNSQGLRIKESTSNYIKYNNISGNDMGIYIFEGSSQNMIYGNNISSNQNYSIIIDRILDPSQFNRIYHNNFIKGTGNQSAYDDSGNFWSNFSHSINGGNYWSDFDEPSEGAWDNNSDLIVDEQYNITGGLNKDNYPLLLPWMQYDPVADFNWTPLVPSTSDTIQFNDISNDSHYGRIVSWSWDFGDGVGYSSARHPQYSYSDDGMYTVRLTVTDDDGAIDFSEQMVPVGNSPPVADFIWSPLSPSTADMISFTDTSFDSDGSIVSWSWDFGDGSGFSYLRNPTYTYMDDGNYIVRLTVTDNDGFTDYVEYEIIVRNMPPEANYIWDPSNPSTQTNIQFIDLSTDSDGSVVSWSWDFGDGVGYSSIRHPQYSYSDDGMYTVRLTVTDDDGAIDFSEQMVPVGNSPPVADFIWSPLSPSTADMISFTDTSFDSDGSIVSWSWDFGDGTSNSSLQDPYYSYSDNGIFSVNLTIKDNDNISSSITYNISVSNMPPVAVNDAVSLIENSTSDINVTINDYDTDGTLNLSSILIISNPLNGNISILTNGIVAYTPDIGFFGMDNFSYTILDDDNEVSNVATVNITVLDVTPPVAEFSFAPLSPSTFEMIQFNDESTDNGVIVSWSWDFGDGVGNSSLQNPSYTYNNDGTYEIILTITDDENAIDSVNHTITILNSPPTALNDLFYLIENSSLALNVTINDYDIDGTLNLSSITITSDVSHGITNITLNGSVIYTPDPGFIGSDSFNYIVKDDDGDTSNIAIVQINVIPSSGQMVDQEQTQNAYSFMLFGDRWGAQSFIPTEDTLSQIDLLMQKRGTPINNLLLCLRSSLSDEDIFSFSVPPGNIPSTQDWVSFDFPDMYITPNVTYYILLRTTGGSSTNCYIWDFGYATTYVEGIFHFSSTAGASWLNYAMYDFCFKTYSPISSPYPSLVFNPTSFDFGTMLENQTDSNTFQIWNGGIGMLSYSINESCSWLSVNPISGTSIGEMDAIDVIIDTSNLTVGLYHYDISILSNGGNSTFGVDVEILPSNPELAITPGSYDFGEVFVDETDSTMFTIWNNGTGTLSYTINESCGWLSVTPVTGISLGENDTIAIGIETTGLSDGIYHCDIYITSNGGNTTFGVDVEVTTPIPSLSFSPSTYDFGELNANSTQDTSLYIWNSGNGTLLYSLSESTPWLSVYPTTGQSDGEADVIQFEVDTTGLVEGTYQSNITILSNGGNGIVSIHLSVVSPMPILSLSPEVLDFGTLFTNETQSSSFEIWNSGNGTLHYTINETCSWVQVNPVNGYSSGEHDFISVQVNTLGLSDGFYHCTITISSDGGTNTIDVYLQIMTTGVTKDQFQEEDGYSFMIFGGRWGAQSFRPTIGTLSHIEILLAKRGLHNQDVEISIRESLLGDDIANGTISINNLTQDPNWFEVDFNNINVTIGDQYYIVIHTQGGSTTNCIIWKFGLNTAYSQGSFHFSSTSGGSWTEYESYDFCFRTYGPAGPHIPALCVTPLYYDFGTMYEGHESSTTFTIWNCGSGTLSYTLNEDCDWLSLDTTSGNSTSETDEIITYVNTTGLTDGSYQCNITISSNGGNVTIEIDLQVSESEPILSFSPDYHDFGSMSAGETNSSSFEIWNGGLGDLTYTLTESCSWLSLSSVQGNSTGEHDTITLWIYTSGLTAGSYTCDITINSNGGAGIFTVDLEVLAAGGLDQEQSQSAYSFMVFGDRWAAQSFVPSLGALSSIDLLMSKRGMFTGDLIVSIRSTLSGENLANVIIPDGYIDETADWITVNLPDITLTVGETYYILVHTSSGTSSSCYLWNFGYNTAYTEGLFHFSNSAGTSWIQYSVYDFCFKTYAG